MYQWVGGACHVLFVLPLLLGRRILFTSREEKRSKKLPTKGAHERHRNPLKTLGRKHTTIDRRPATLHSAHTNNNWSVSPSKHSIFPLFKILFYFGCRHPHKGQLGGEGGQVSSTVRAMVPECCPLTSWERTCLACFSLCGWRDGRTDDQRMQLDIYIYPGQDLTEP